jgi:hypothetical protein
MFYLGKTYFILCFLFEIVIIFFKKKENLRSLNNIFKFN